MGFPGYIRKGIVRTPPNLNTDLWKNVNLKKLLKNAFDKPVRIANDADIRVRRSQRTRIGNGNYPGNGFWHRVIVRRTFAASFELSTSSHYKKQNLP